MMPLEQNIPLALVTALDSTALPVDQSVPVNTVSRIGMPKSS